MAEGEIIYLDNNATTQLDPAVIEEMLPFLTKYYGNPSSGYGFAVMARKAINLARERLAALLGCEPTEIVFTSGGTESNNAVINSALQFEPRGKRVVTSAVEHSAVLRPLPGSWKSRVRRHISGRRWTWQSRRSRIGGCDSPRDSPRFNHVG